MTPLNLFGNVSRARRAGAATVADPGNGGTIRLYNRDFCVVTLASAGTATLEAASQQALGTRILVIAQAAVTVNSVVLADGEYTYFVVSLDASGDNEWVQGSSEDIAGLQARVTTAETEIQVLEDQVENGTRRGVITAEADTATITAAEVLGGFILGTPVSAATYTLPTAELLVAAIENAAVGDIIRFSVHNAGADADAITLAAGSGASDEGTLTIAQDVTRDFVITLTNVTASAEAYILYGIG